MSSLKLAALRGVDVRVLIPDRPDQRLVWLAAFAYAQEAIAAGISLQRYTDGFMHQKVLLIDDRVAAIGSANLDNRSFRLNFELTPLVFDAAFVAEVAEMLRRDFARSRPHDRAFQASRSVVIRSLAPAARLFAPLL
jgi:cardiolipin synthase